MMKPKKCKTYNKVKHLRVSDEIWAEFESLKPRDKSWNLHIQEIVNAIKYFKSL